MKTAEAQNARKMPNHKIDENLRNLKLLNINLMKIDED
jgi:hypothetical protein